LSALPRASANVTGFAFAVAIGAILWLCRDALIDGGAHVGDRIADREAVVGEPLAARLRTAASKGAFAAASTLGPLAAWSAADPVRQPASSTGRVTLAGELLGTPIPTCLVHAQSPLAAALPLAEREFALEHVIPPGVTRVALCAKDAAIALLDLGVGQMIDGRAALQPPGSLLVQLVNVPSGLRDANEIAIQLAPGSYRSDVEKRAYLLCADAWVPRLMGDADTISLPLYFDREGEVALSVSAKGGGPPTTLRMPFDPRSRVVAFDFAGLAGQVHVAPLRVQIDFAPNAPSGRMGLCLLLGERVIASRPIVREPGREVLFESFPGVPSGSYRLELQPPEAADVRSAPFAFAANRPGDARLRLGLDASVRVRLQGASTAQLEGVRLSVLDSAGGLCAARLARSRDGEEPAVAVTRLRPGLVHVQLTNADGTYCTPIQVLDLAEGERVDHAAPWLPAVGVTVDRAAVGDARCLALRQPDGVRAFAYLGSAAKPKLLLPAGRYVIEWQGREIRCDWQAGQEHEFAPAK
jgi:hypothetical protein